MSFRPEFIRPALIGVSVLVLGAAAWWLLPSKKEKAAPVPSPTPVAQEQAQTSAQAQTSPVPGTPPANEAQSVPVSNENAATSTEFWTKRCDDKTSHCEIFQRLVLNENNLRLIEFAIGYPKEKNTAEAVIVLPLGILITDGIQLKLDDGAPSKAMVRTCVQDGCFIVMNLPDDFMEKMKSAHKVTVGFMDGAGKQVNIELSLDGFGEKLATLKE